MAILCRQPVQVVGMNPPPRRQGPGALTGAGFEGGGMCDWEVERCRDMCRDVLVVHALDRLDRFARNNLQELRETDWRHQCL